MIPFYFKIEILEICSEFIAVWRKGLGIFMHIIEISVFFKAGGTLYNTNKNKTIRLPFENSINVTKYLWQILYC